MSNQLKLWLMTTRHRIASDEGSAFKIEMVVELVTPNIKYHVSRLGSDFDRFT
jgi:hypothetical protein